MGFNGITKYMCKRKSAKHVCWKKDQTLTIKFFLWLLNSNKSNAYAGQSKAKSAWRGNAGQSRICTLVEYMRKWEGAWVSVYVFVLN